MKRALLVLALAACGRRAAAPPDCARTCDRFLDLAAAHLDAQLGKIADHSDEATAANLRARAAEARDAERLTCLEQCDVGEVDRACVAAATDLDSAQRCVRVRP